MGGTELRLGLKVIVVGGCVDVLVFQIRISRVDEKMRGFVVCVETDWNGVDGQVGVGCMIRRFGVEAD